MIVSAKYVYCKLAQKNENDGYNLQENTVIDLDTKS